MRTDRKTLLEALRKCKLAVSSRPGIPALTGILLDVVPVGAYARLTATDLELTATVDVETEAPEEWRALIPFKLLLATVRAATGDTVSIDPVGTNGCRMVGDAPFGHVSVAGATIRLLPVEDFPTIPTGPVPLTAVDASELARVAAVVSPFASEDTARPVLTGVLMEWDSKGARMVATDSYRLVIGSFEPDRFANMRAIIPARALETVGRFCKPLRGVSRGTVGIGANEHAGSSYLGAVTFYGPGMAWTLTTRTIEGEYPNYAQLIPETADVGRLTYDRKSFARILAQAAPYAKDSPIRLELNGTVALSASAADLGTFAALVPDAQWSGEDMAIAWNVEYARSCVEASTAGTAYVRDGQRPAVFVDDLTTALLMPVRLPAPVS